MKSWRHRHCQSLMIEAEICSRSVVDLKGLERSEQVVGSRGRHADVALQEFLAANFGETRGTRRLGKTVGYALVIDFKKRLAATPSSSTNRTQEAPPFM